MFSKEQKILGKFFSKLKVEHGPSKLPEGQQ